MSEGPRDRFGQDRFGLGWRPALAASLLTHLDRIDLLEVLADDYFSDPQGARALRTLGAQVPLTLHSTKLGLATAAAADPRWIERMARLVDTVRPLYWSDHLAFVRAGGIEIGHLAAPPRRPETLEGLAANLDHTRRIVGTAPLVENIATLIDPPGSSLSEAAWISGASATGAGGLLLDLHNLYCNAVNFGFDAMALLDQIPLQQVRAVHVAGGMILPAGRRLDDHLHPVPDAVFTLLEELAARTAQPLDVILERDGAFPAVEVLLAELDQARRAVATGRARQALLRTAA